MGQILIKGLRSIQSEHSVIGEVRGLGLMVAAEFVNADGSANSEAVSQVIKACFDQQVLLINCGTYDQAIRIVPPLVVNEEQILQFLGIFRSAVASL